MTPAPRKPSPSSPATNPPWHASTPPAPPRSAPAMNRAGALRWWRAGYQAGRQAAEHEYQAAARWERLVASYHAQHAATQQAKLDPLLLETNPPLAPPFSTNNPLHPPAHPPDLLPEGLVPCQYPRAAAYIFTSGEVIALMRAAGRLSRRLPAATYQALLGMLAVTGMRPGEAYVLDRGDVDLDGGTVTITSTKNYTSPELPLHAPTVPAPAAYAHLPHHLS